MNIELVYVSVALIKPLVEACKKLIEQGMVDRFITVILHQVPLRHVGLVIRIMHQ